jgi:outer membrane receptor protein involved in Fe transport
MAFIPPTPAQLTTNTNPNTTVTGAFLDPVTGKTYTTNRNAGTNGNPDLKPQTSKSWNGGVIWEPQAELLTSSFIRSSRKT